MNYFLILIPFQNTSLLAIKTYERLRAVSEGRIGNDLATAIAPSQPKLFLLLMENDSVSETLFPTCPDRQKSRQHTNFV